MGEGMQLPLAGIGECLLVRSFALHGIDSHLLSLEHWTWLQYSV